MAQQLSSSQDALQLPLPAPASRPPLARLASSPGPSPQAKTGIVVFSGGSATNSLVDVFEGVRAAANAATLSYVIPISDNGGSTSEIIRVFGGPGMCLFVCFCCCILESPIVTPYSHLTQLLFFICFFRI